MISNLLHSKCKFKCILLSGMLYFFMMEVPIIQNQSIIKINRICSVLIFLANLIFSKNSENFRWLVNFLVRDFGLTLEYLNIFVCFNYGCKDQINWIHISATIFHTELVQKQDFYNFFFFFEDFFPFVSYHSLTKFIAL